MIQQCSVESSPDGCIKMFLAAAVPVSVDPNATCACLLIALVYTPYYIGLYALSM